MMQQVEQAAIEQGAVAAGLYLEFPGMKNWGIASQVKWKTIHQARLSTGCARHLLNKKLPAAISGEFLKQVSLQALQQGSKHQDQPGNYHHPEG